MNIKMFFVCAVAFFGFAGQAFGLSCADIVQRDSIGISADAVGKPVDQILVSIYKDCESEFVKKWGTPYHFVANVSDLSGLTPASVITKDTRFTLNKPVVKSPVVAVVKRAPLPPVPPWMVMKPKDPYSILGGESRSH